MEKSDLSKERFLEKLLPLLENRGLHAARRVEHRYHIQFEVSGEKCGCMVQIYQSKKGTHARVINDIGGCEARVLAAIDEMFGRLPLSSPEKKSAVSAEKQHETGLIGTDESGKGDFFGPLVVAAVHIMPDDEEYLRNMGVCDSKLLGDSKAVGIAENIRDEFKYSIVAIGPEKYNEIYSEMKNVNKILGWAHARAIEDLLEEVDCQHAVTDQFGDKSHVENALMKKGRRIQLQQRPRAEEITAVAAASILARAEFLNRLAELGARFSTTLPKGASSRVDDAARGFVRRHGREALEHVAKMHFKNSTRI